nr:MAG TPA: baseplate wedge protein [Caudoviricetes sp.]
MASVKSLTIGGKTIFDLVYPVGSIYETDNEGFDPNTSFGGTWERIKGKVIVGVDKADGAFDTVGKTGGEKNHTLIESELPQISGDLQFHGSENGSHIYNRAGHFNGTKVTGKYRTATAMSGAFSFSTLSFAFGGGASHNNMPPYYVAYIWRRTA